MGEVILLNRRTFLTRNKYREGGIVGEKLLGKTLDLSIMVVALGVFLFSASTVVFSGDIVLRILNVIAVFISGLVFGLVSVDYVREIFNRYK